MELSIIIPAYNEADRLPASLRTIQQFFVSESEQPELIVVDDGSTDATARVVSEQFPGVRVIRQPANLGKGAAVRTGMLAAQGDWRLLCDADLSTPIDEYRRLQSRQVDAQVIIASRRAPGARVEKSQALWKVVFGQMGNLLIRLLLVPGIRDTQCGFKLFGPRAHELFHLQLLNRFGYDFELLWLARRQGLAVVEVPVRWINDERSRVGRGDYFRTLLEILQIYWHRWRGHYPQRTA